MSATTSDVGRLLVRIEASTAALRGQLAEAEGRIGQFTRSTEQKLGGFERMFASAGQNALRSITGIAAGVIAVNSVSQAIGNMVRTADEAAAAATRIGSAVGNMQAGRQIFDQISASAQRTGTSASDAVDSFLRFSIATRQIGGTNAQALQLVDMLQKMAVVSGTAGQSGGAAMMQLGQALASGRLQGDELRSILENMPTLAEGLANQLGVSVGMLRQMGTEGKLTSEVVFAALLRMAPEVNRQFEQMPLSVQRATTSLSQAWSNLITQLDRATGITERIAAATQGASDRIQRLADNLVPKTATEQLREVNEQIERLIRLQREAGEVAVRNQAHRGSIGTGAANAAAGVYGAEGIEEQIRLLREQAAELGRLADAEKAAADRAREAEAAQAALRAAENARQAVLERLKEVQEALGGANDKTREQMEALRTIVAAGDEALRRYGISAQQAAGMLSALETKADGVRRVVADLNAQTAQINAGGVEGRIQAALRQAAPGGNVDLLDAEARGRIADAERARSQAAAAARIEQAEAEARLAAARRQGGEAGERLARVEQQVVEFLKEGGTAAQAAALRTALLGAAQDRNAAASQGNLQSIAKVRQELTLVATAAERAADAATQGAAAERRADQASKARAQALKVARDGTEAYNAAYREFLALIQRADRGEARQDIAHRPDALRNEIALIERETQLIGALPGHREAEIAALRVRQELIASGKQYTEQEIREVEELARARARAAQVQQQMEQQLHQVRQISSEIARDVSTALFDQMMDKDKGASVVDWFKALFRRIAIAAIQANIVLPITQQIVGAMPGLFGATGVGGGSMGSLGGLGALFGGSGGQIPIQDASGNITGYIGQGSSGQTIMGGLRGFNPGNYISGATPINTGWGWLDGGLNTPIFSEVAAGAQGPTLSGAPLGASQGGLTWGGAAMGAAGILGGAYGAYSGLQRGGVGGYTQAAGGVATAGLSAAAMAGAAIPVYGWIAAAVLSIIGALLPGQKPSGFGQESGISLATGETWWRGLTGDRYSPENREQSAQAAERIGDLARQLGDALGGMRLGIDAAVGVTSSRGNGPGDLYLRVGEQRAQFANDEDGAKALADRTAEFLLNEFRSRATGDYAGILNASPTIEKLQENLTYYEGTYKALTNSAEATNAFSQALKQVNDQWQVHIDKANELSLATGELTRKRDEEISRLQQQRDLQLAGVYQGLSLREAAANGNSPYSALSELMRSNLFLARAQEIEALRKQLTDLGVATATVTAQVARLAQIQSAEYWRNFAATMEGIDFDTIDRILRATDRGGEADLRAFDQQAKATIEALRQQLAQFPELTMEEFNKKIMEKEEALAIQRQALLDEQLEAAKQRGQGVRDYLNGLMTQTGPGGVSAIDALTAAQSQFASDLTAARGGDANAFGRITSTADRLLSAARGVYASSPQFQAMREWVINSLGSLPGVDYPGTVAGGDSAALLSEIRALRAEVAQLRAVTTATGEAQIANGSQTVLLLQQQADAAYLDLASPKAA